MERTNMGVMKKILWNKGKEQILEDSKEGPISENDLLHCIKVQAKLLLKKKRYSIIQGIFLFKENKSLFFFHIIF